MKMLLLVSVIFAAELVWSPSSSYYDYEATLELCSRGSNLYGYRQTSSATCTAPGPTIRFTRGKNYRLVFSAPVGSFSSGHTNIHTHGLHISGDGGADDITRDISPGGCLVYNYSIPSFHAGGTFWYHAHPHGYTDPQVSGGAFGMMLVNDVDAGGLYPEIPTSLSSTIRDNIILWTQNEITAFCAKISNSVVCKNIATGSSDLPLIQNQWHRIRLGASQPSGSTTTLTLSCTGTKCANGCIAREMLRDGLWRSVVPSSAATSWTIGAASRIDLAIKCSNTNAHKLSFGNTNMNLIISTGSANSATPFAGTQTWNPVLPPYMTNLATATVSKSATIQMQAAAISYNGASVAWDPNTPADSFPIGSVVQFTIGGTGPHPFHLHAFPMQVTGTGCTGYTTGEFYDTIQSTATCTVRFNAITFSGRTPMHCHFLAHEDNGAMTWLNVQNGPAFGSVETC